MVSGIDCNHNFFCAPRHFTHGHHFFVLASGVRFTAIPSLFAEGLLHGVGGVLWGCIAALWEVVVHSG